MLGRGVVALPHNAAKRGYQFRSGASYFVVMVEREFGEHLFTFGRQREKHFTTVILSARAVDKSSRLQAVHQFYSAVVADFHTIGQFADSRAHPCWHPLDGQHELVLAPLQPCLLHHLLTEVEVAADLVTELRERLVIRQGEPFHAVDCIVLRSNMPFMLYRNTI